MISPSVVLFFSNVSHLHSPFYFCSFLILKYYVILQTIKHVLMLY